MLQMLEAGSARTGSISWFIVTIQRCDGWSAAAQLLACFSGMISCLLVVSTVRQHLYTKQSLCLKQLLPLGKVAKRIRLLQQLERWGTARIPPSIFIIQVSLFGVFSPQALFGTQEDMPDYFFLWMFCKWIPGAVVWAAWGWCRII